MATSTLVSIGSSPTNSTTPNLAISGLASGMDWSTVVTELANAERAPETQWQNQQSTIAQQQAAYATITSDLTTLQLDAQTLTDPSFFNSVVASSSTNTVATASAASGTPTGNYAFSITQLATAAQVNGTAGVSQKLVPDGNPADATIGTAGFSNPVTAGTFTVNGAQINIATSDSLQQVFNNIALATGSKVSASYDLSTDKITLASSDGSPIVLGSATDSSNFLQVAQLYNNNSGSITSGSALGHVNTAVALNAADLQTPITDGGSGNGAFIINGVTFNYNASTDGLQDILNNINDSAAGVSASYDTVNNRFVLANKTTGDVGISMQDVPGQGNFLAATGLSGGALSHGKNLLYTLNGGTQQLVSQSNTIGSSSSGITGLVSHGAGHRLDHGERQFRHDHHRQCDSEICHGLQFGPVFHHQPADCDHGGGWHGDARHAHRRHQHHGHRHQPALHAVGGGEHRRHLRGRDPVVRSGFSKQRPEQHHRLEQCRHADLPVVEQSQMM